jgi:ElaB/YqjD/DUF883 family membrane-anchored ribosome-binding protein
VTVGLGDTLKGFRKKAEDAAVEHKDQIHETVQKAEVAADQRTGGKYHDQIQQAAGKVDTFVEGLDATDGKAVGEEAGGGAGKPPAS